MSYQYKPTKAEERAAALLREKGWNVGEPQCLECHGTGVVWVIEAHRDGIFTNSTASTVSCSQGCEMPINYVLSTSNAVITSASISADGTTGMRWRVS